MAKQASPQKAEEKPADPQPFLVPGSCLAVDIGTFKVRAGAYGEDNQLFHYKIAENEDTLNAVHIATKRIASKSLTQVFFFDFLEFLI